MKEKFKVTKLHEQNELAVFELLFRHLEVDPYIQEGYRFKNIMRVRTDTVKVVKGSHEPLFQSGKYNPVHGDIIRTYPEIPSIYHNELLHNAIKTYAKICGVQYEDEILVQAQRIKTTKTLQGLPAVEGPHQDGKQFIAIFCAGRYNVRGGESQLSLNKGKDVVLRHTLEPGEMLIIDDRHFYHYATPVDCKDPQQPGFRDIFLFSFPSSRASQVSY